MQPTYQIDSEHSRCQSVGLNSGWLMHRFQPFKFFSYIYTCMSLNDLYFVPSRWTSVPEIYKLSSRWNLAHVMKIVSSTLEACCVSLTEPTWNARCPLFRETLKESWQLLVALCLHSCPSFTGNLKIGYCFSLQGISDHHQPMCLRENFAQKTHG